MHKLLMLCCVVLGHYTHAQQQPDSIRLTLGQAEEIFVKKNLFLLSMKYQVDAAKANEIQQKLYDNPTLSTELSVWGSNNKWFDIGNKGQKTIGVDQLIILAGKRNKRVSLAKEQTNEASIVLLEVLRGLKYELSNSFHTIAAANELTKTYNGQLEMLQRIINAYQDQSEKRNVSLKDVIRLRTEYIQLSADRNAVIMEAITARQTLQLLLDTSAVVIPVKENITHTSLPVAADLVQKALNNRPDMQLEQSRLKQEQLNYNLQKALARPDITIGAGYDQRSSYVDNLYSVRAAIDLPFFNRNQGNIKSAKAMIQSAETVVKYREKQVESEVFASLSRLKETDKEYNELQKSFNKDFSLVNQHVIENFNKGNISILEFLDFFENYNLAVQQLNQLEKQWRIAWEDIEYTIGEKLKK